MIVVELPFSVTLRMRVPGQCASAACNRFVRSGALSASSLIQALVGAHRSIVHHHSCPRFSTFITVKCSTAKPAFPSQRAAAPLISAYITPSEAAPKTGICWNPLSWNNVPLRSLSIMATAASSSVLSSATTSSSSSSASTSSVSAPIQSAVASTAAASITSASGSSLASSPDASPAVASTHSVRAGGSLPYGPSHGHTAHPSEDKMPDEAVTHDLFGAIVKVFCVHTTPSFSMPVSGRMFSSCHCIVRNEIAGMRICFVLKAVVLCNICST